MVSRKKPAAKNYNGLSVNERLVLSGSLDKFHAAARLKNRKIMIALLKKVGLSEQYATLWVETLLGDQTFFYR
jgi:hypothetical protein